MRHKVRVHKVDKSNATTQMLDEIRQFMEAVFSDRKHRLVTRNTDTQLLFYLRVLRKERKVPKKRNQESEQ
jgi:hypothetical protein